MGNLRTQIERDLSSTIEGDFSLPVVLISPNGKRITETVDGRPLSGRVLYSRKENSGDGSDIVVPAPLVTLRESSLEIVPKTGERWVVLIPESVLENAPMKAYLIDYDSAVEYGHSMGVINLPLLEIADNEEIE